MTAATQLTREQTDGASSLRPTPGALRTLPSQPTVVEAFRILEEVRDTLNRDPVAARAGVDRLASILKVAEDASVPAPVRGGLAPWQRRKVEAFIEERLGGSTPIRALAELVCLSSGHFSRVFKETFGRSPHAHIVRLRIVRAQEAMLATNEPLSRIALTYGFSDQAHFANVFRRLVGITPRDWRRANAVPR